MHQNIQWIRINVCRLKHFQHIDGLSRTFVGFSCSNFAKTVYQNSTRSRRWQHFESFSNFDKCRPEVAGYVISGVAVEWVGVDALQNLVTEG